jgi:hypothetical protein
MSWRARTGSQRRVALVAVLAVHAALFTLLGRTWMPRPTSPAADRVSVRLIPTTPALVRPQPPADPTPRTAKPVSAIRPNRPRPVDPAPPQDVPTVAADTPGNPSGITFAPEAPASQPRPLDLTVRRGSVVAPDSRNQALQDPRSNTPRTTPEQRMSAAFDTRVIEESLGDGRRRIRQGSSCVIVTPSRAAQINPFDDRSARTPSLVSPCP